MQGSLIARRRLKLRPVFGALLTLGLALSGAASHASVLTASLATQRQQHASAVLPDGRVIVAGGKSSVSGVTPSLASTEIYDPATGTWSAGAALNVARDSYGLVALADGRILAFGGQSGSTLRLDSAEIYDPVAGTWTLIAPMSAARRSPGFATLSDGRVLIVGGDTTGKAAEIFDPLTGTFTATAASQRGRDAAGVAVLADGRVLLAGGTPPGQPEASDSTIELWDPATGLWTLGGMSTWMRSGRSDFTLTLLPNGKALAAGGFSGGVSFIAKAELYDPATGTWSFTGQVNVPRARHAAQRLDSGDVLINGGFPSTWLQEASSEIYDVASGTWRTADWMTRGRNAQSVSRLPGGDLLVAGGGSGPTATAEIIHPGCAAAGNALMPSSQSFAQAGGSGITSLTAPIDCPWTVTSVPAWVSVTSPATGTGSAGITYSVAPMTAYGTRSALLHVADQTLTLNQIGACDPALNPSLTPTSRNFPLAGGTGTLSVTHNAACTWSVANVPAWITVTSGASGQGNGTLTYTVASNPGSQRTAMMNINGRYFTVDQAANVPVCDPNAVPAISPLSQNFTSTGGSGSIAVTHGVACNWSAYTPASWITITAGASGTQNGTVSYTVAANAGTARSATITAAGKTFTVTQDAYSSPACNPIAASIGSWRQGDLSSTDCRGGTRGLNYYTDRYSFSGTAGQQIYISMTGGFDTYLNLKNPGGTLIASNDNSNGSSNARIPAGFSYFTLPTTGTYIVEATSSAQFATGYYDLSIY